MKAAMLIGVLIGVTSGVATVAKTTDALVLHPVYIDRYFDNVGSHRKAIQTLIETSTFRFDLQAKTGEMQDAKGDVVTCRWGGRPSRPLGTVANISFSCDQNRAVAVSGVLDTDHLMMLLHVSMRDASFQADALVQMRQ